MKFIIYGDPIPQGRPRFFRRGRYVGTYDPAKSVAFKRRVAVAAENAGITIQEDDLHMLLEFFFKRPQRLLKRDILGVALPHFFKPDLDNCVKAVLDGLKWIAYKDDCQVTSLRANKFYCERDGRARVEVTIF